MATLVPGNETPRAGISHSNPGRAATALYGLVRVRSTLSGWIRYSQDRFILLPAADFLPRSWALGLASLFGLVDAMMPTAGDTARREARVFGLSGWAALRGAGRRLSLDRRDLVEFRRIIKRRDDPTKWPVRHIGDPGGRALLESGRAALVVTGHFSMAPALALTNVVGSTVGAAAINPIPDKCWDPVIMRERLRNQILHSLAPVVAPHVTAKMANVGLEDVQTILLEPLLNNGIAAIMIDHPWPSERAIQRPFAGMQSQQLAKGAARIARLAQVPIVMGKVIRARDGTIEAEWAPVTQPPAAEDKAAEVPLMNELLDQMEIYIGRHPFDYAYPVGYDRSWNAKEEQWDDAR